MSSTVYLVGAGPGDPELLTQKALSLIQSAELTLHDDLISPEILNLAGRNAEIENVGKRCGQKRITQKQIHSRMVEAALAGKKVVRLQSGDPLIYGRLGEEMEALRAAEIDFQVVPGVTSAFAAAASAKISLADRRGDSRVIFLSAHSCGIDPYSQLAPRTSPKSTLAIYMPGQDYARIHEFLRESGFAPATPCLIVSRASQPGESRHSTFLGQLALEHPAEAPAILLIGNFAGVFEPTDQNTNGEYAFTT